MEAQLRLRRTDKGVVGHVEIMPPEGPRAKVDSTWVEHSGDQTARAIQSARTEKPEPFAFRFGDVRVVVTDELHLFGVDGEVLDDLYSDGRLRGAAFPARENGGCLRYQGEER